MAGGGKHLDIYCHILLQNQSLGSRNIYISSKLALEQPAYHTRSGLVASISDPLRFVFSFTFLLVKLVSSNQHHIKPTLVVEVLTQAV